MKKIKGLKKTNVKYIHKLKPKVKEEDQKECSSFALVVVRKLPWYKKLAKKIRNYFVIYRWRKTR